MVMIGNDNIDAQRPGVLHLRYIGTAAIGGDKQRGSPGMNLLQ